MAEGSALEMVDQTVRFVHPKIQQSCGFVSVQKKVNILLFCPVVLSSVFFRISGLTYGELSEWSKVQHSKCRVHKMYLGFESLTLRQKVQ